MTIERFIISAAARLRRQREPHLVATLVRTKGSAYRRPGARMLMTQFRWISGSVSGGCLEGDIASQGWWRTRSGEPVVITYDSRMPEGADDADVRAAFGLGCEGVVEVMLERAGTPGRLDPLELADRCLRDQTRGAVATVIRSEAPGVGPGMRIGVVAGGEPSGDGLGGPLSAAMLADCRNALASGETCNRTYRSELGNVDVLIEAIVPPPRLYLFGTGHDAIPLVQLARSVGWDVSVCTTEARVSVRRRFACVTGADELLVGTPAELAARIDEADRAVAIVMSHHYPTDCSSLGSLLRTRARYIGVLGPRARTMRMLAELGVPQLRDPRIHAPVGLAIGAETPQESAVAIIAEVQSVLAQSTGERLRDRDVSIHAPSRAVPYTVTAKPLAPGSAVRAPAPPALTPVPSSVDAAVQPLDAETAARADGSTRTDLGAGSAPMLPLPERTVSSRAVTVDMTVDIAADAVAATRDEPLVEAPVSRRTTREHETAAPVLP